MEGATREPAARRESNDDRHGDPLSVVELRGDVDELVEATGDEVGELHLADGPESLGGGANRRADDRVLGERRVEAALGAKLLHEPVGHLERAAEGADVLADAEDRGIPTHLVPEGIRDRLQVGHLPSSGGWRGGGGHAALLSPLVRLQCDHGALPSPIGSQASAKTPVAASSGSGMGESSALAAHCST